MGCKSSKAALRNGLEVAVDVVDQVDATAVTANAKSSKNIEDVEFVFFDLDDTLYQNGYKTERMLTKRIGEVSERLFNLTEEVIFALYQVHYNIYITVIIYITVSMLCKTSSTQKWLKNGITLNKYRCCILAINNRLRNDKFNYFYGLTNAQLR